ncbi:hypothetical protein [Bilophila wadsworthia]|uniref:hypothetical protein n=2 Tax=Bilophila wadsworthia TaxID=35833 RepID=UPI00242F5AA2|nr:hypothetical protein [Bilophila wadsworthia]
MEPVEKSYFFYKNTPEYKKIQNRLDWSIVAIIYTCAIRIAIDNSYEFFMNVIIAIATGYIISYFYFKLITYKSIYDEEIILLKVTTEIGICFSKIYDEVKKSDDVIIKFKLLALYSLILPYSDIFRKHFYAHIAMARIVDMIKFSNEIPSNKESFIELMKVVIPKYISLLGAFKDREQIIEEFVELKNSGYYSNEIQYLLDLLYLTDKTDTPLDT